MKLEKLPVLECLNLEYLKQHNFSYGLVYLYDKVQLNKIEELDLDQENLIEAKFFNDHSQLHIYKRDELEAVLVTDEDDEDFFTETQILMNDKYGKEMRIKNYLNYDKDGQAFIAYSRPYQVIV